MFYNQTRQQIKRIITTLAITSTLAITQACALQGKSSQTSETSTYDATAVADANPHAEHNMGEAKKAEPQDNSPHNHHMESSHEEHSGHSQLEPANAIAKLNIPSQITPQKPVSLAIDITNIQGQPIAKFDQFQQKLMHLIVVSNDLQSFQHLHPTYKGNGRFEVQTDFPYPGGYTLFSDYKVAGKAEQVSLLNAEVTGQSPAAQPINLATIKTFGNTKVSLKLPQGQIKSTEKISVNFNLEDIVSKQPPKDLKPYLGEKGHLVIIKESSPLTQADYIHAHALKDNRGSEIRFLTSFPKPGKYKMWGQFNRNGKIVTADFWVNVQ